MSIWVFRHEKYKKNSSNTFTKDSLWRDCDCEELRGCMATRVVLCVIQYDTETNPFWLQQSDLSLTSVNSCFGVLQ